MTNSAPPHLPPTTCQMLCLEITLNPILPQFIVFAVPSALNVLAGSLTVDSFSGSSLSVKVTFSERPDFGMLSELPIPPVIFSPVSSSLAHHCHLCVSLSVHFLVACLTHGHIPVMPDPEQYSANVCKAGEWPHWVGCFVLGLRTTEVNITDPWPMVVNLSNNHQYITVSSSVAQPY